MYIDIKNKGYLGPFPTSSRAGIFSLFKNSDRLGGTFPGRRSHLLKTGFFRQVRGGSQEVTRPTAIP
jgi:hypothetical protein